MRCPKCGINHRQTSGMTCVCGYSFILNPKTDFGWTDGKFKALLDRVSQNDTRYFTKNQLIAYSKKKPKRSGKTLYNMVFLSVIIGLMTAYFIRIPMIGFIVGVLLFIAFLRWGPKSTKLDSDELSQLIGKWVSKKDPIKKLILTPSLNEKPPIWQERDIYAYGVEQILIVQHDIIVDTMVLNEFHTEQKTLILSANGYPDYILQLALNMVQRNKTLKIFALHDTMTKNEGSAFIEGISKMLRCEDDHIIDLGLYDNSTEPIQKLLKTAKSERDDAMSLDYIPLPALLMLLTLSMESDTEIMGIMDEALKQAALDTSASASFG